MEVSKVMEAPPGLIHLQMLIHELNNPAIDGTPILGHPHILHIQEPSNHYFFLQIYWIYHSMKRTAVPNGNISMIPFGMCGGDFCGYGPMDFCAQEVGMYLKPLQLRLYNQTLYSPLQPHPKYSKEHLLQMYHDVSRFLANTISQ